jgi:hypothetical protein
MRHCERQAVRRIDARADRMAVERVAKDEQAVKDCLARLPDHDALETLRSLSMGRMALHDRWTDRAREAAEGKGRDAASLAGDRALLDAEGQEAWDALMAEHAASPDLAFAVHAFCLQEARYQGSEATDLVEGKEADDYEAMLDEARVDPSREAQLTHRYEVAAERAFYRGWGEVKKGRLRRELAAERRYRQLLRDGRDVPDLASLQAIMGPATAPAPGNDTPPGGAAPAGDELGEAMIDAMRGLARMSPAELVAAASLRREGPASPSVPGPACDGPDSAEAPALSGHEGPVFPPEPRSAHDDRDGRAAEAPTAAASSGDEGPVFPPNRGRPVSTMPTVRPR